VRYFLERTWGAPTIDEEMLAYDVASAAAPGAADAPLTFLSGALFSADISVLYEALTLPVWVAHGVRGDFVKYDGAATLASRSGWKLDVFQTGALPHFEVPQAFFAAYDAFLGAG
jgi:hypothetical protein